MKMGTEMVLTALLVAYSLCSYLVLSYIRNISPFKKISLMVYMYQSPNKYLIFKQIKLIVLIQILTVECSQHQLMT